MLPLLTAAILVLAVSTSASAQIEFLPGSLTFETEVGTPTVQSITIWNNTPNICTIIDVYLADAYSAYDWIWAAGAPPNDEIPAGESYKINVLFDPAEAGQYVNTLNITYNLNVIIPPTPPTLDPTVIPDYTKSITLNGTANDPVTIDPTDLVEDLLDFYGAALKSETLTGEGRGKSADNRARALGHQLMAVAKIIYDGASEVAIDKLYSILRRADGGRNTFISGTGLGEFNSRVLELIAALGG